jgi:uncharacterized protein
MKAETIAAQPDSAPVQQAERIIVIDILRGFALLGILLVNMEIFIHPIQYIMAPPPADSLPLIDRIVGVLVRFFAETKFYSLFSFLFGLGFALLMTRLESRGMRFVPVYIRRLLALLAIGLVHAYLIWVGDILVLYALLGFPLLLFRKAKPRTLLIWAVIFLLLPLIFYSAIASLLELARMDPASAAMIDQSFAETARQYQAQIAQSIEIYSNGGFLEITAQRARDVSFMSIGNFFLAPSVFAMFLIGLWFARKEKFSRLQENLPFFRKLFAWSLALGLIGSLLFTYFMEVSGERFVPNLNMVLVTLGQVFGAPMLSLCYASGLTLLAVKPGWTQRLAPLASAGQMALTVYLLESIICTLVFYGYGLGLFNQVGRTAGLLLGIVVYAALVAFSVFWMKRFLFGPAEWLWRTLTYLKPQPMRRSG